MWAARGLARLLWVAWLAAVPAFAASSAPTPAAAAVTRGNAYWMRIESRIESGYFQQDAPGLQALATALSAGGTAGEATDAKWRSYYAALIAYRQALLAKNDEDRAWPYSQQCVAALDRVLVLDSGSAEALALQSACLALQSDLDPWRSPLAAPRSLARIDKALKLAPANPRVLLLGALAARERPTLFGGDAQRSFRLMQRAAAEFERDSAQAKSLPGWGAADAFTGLAQDYLGRGEALAARNVLERALLLEPRFAQARRLMEQIVAG